MRVLGLTVGLFFKVGGLLLQESTEGFSFKHHEVMGCPWIIQGGILRG